MRACRRGAKPNESQDRRVRRDRPEDTLGGQGLLWSVKRRSSAGRER